MKRSYFILLVIGLTTALFLSCEENREKWPDPGTPVDPGPNLQLSVSTTELQLAGRTDYDYFTISRQGNGTVDWEITSLPEWATVSTSEGELDMLPQRIMLTIDRSKLSDGMNTGMLKIESNAGSHEIALTINNVPPKIKVWLPILHFDREVVNTSVNLMNIGGFDLNWQVDQKPDWIEMPSEGLVVTESPVPITVKLTDLDYGEHKGEIELSSNGGNTKISLNVFYEKVIEIYPGKGAAKVNIGNNYSRVKKEHGTAEKARYDKLRDKTVQYVALYPSKGITFVFRPSRTLLAYPDGHVTQHVELRPPYDGLTPDSLTIGGSADDIFKIHGTPTLDDTENNKYVYEDQGVIYYYDPDSRLINGIDIFIPPEEKN